MIAIKGMDMPKNCIACLLYVGRAGEGHCAITHEWNATGGLNRLASCPLNEIITCKDCKYNYENTCDLDGYGIKDDYFCENGESEG